MTPERWSQVSVWPSGLVRVSACGPNSLSATASDRPGQRGRAGAGAAYVVNVARVQALGPGEALKKASSPGARGECRGGRGWGRRGMVHQSLREAGVGPKASSSVSHMVSTPREARGGCSSGLWQPALSGSSGTRRVLGSAPSRSVSYRQQSLRGAAVGRKASSSVSHVVSTPRARRVLTP